MKLLHTKVGELEAYRFNANDHCRLAILVDPETSGGPLLGFLKFMIQAIVFRPIPITAPSRLSSLYEVKSYFIPRKVFFWRKEAIASLHLLMMRMILKTQALGVFI